VLLSLFLINLHHKINQLKKTVKKLNDAKLNS